LNPTQDHFPVDHLPSHVLDPPVSSVLLRESDLDFEPSETLQATRLVPLNNLSGSALDAELTRLQRRFVQACYYDRFLLKYLRQVNIDSFTDLEARVLTQGLLKIRGVPLGPLLNPTGQPVERLAGEDMEQAVLVIAEQFMLKQARDHGRAITQAANKNDVEQVEKLLAVRIRKGSHVRATAIGSMGAGYMKIVADNAAGMSSLPRISGAIGKKITLAPHSIHTIGGTPGSGKTAFAEEVLLELVQKGVPCLDISCEMTSDIKYGRYAQHLYGDAVGPKAVLENRQDNELLILAARELASLPLHVKCDAVNIDTICAAIENAVNEYGVKVAVVDFVQQIEVPGALRPSLQSVSEATMRLYQTAKDTGCAVILLSQMNRSERDTVVPPTMRSLEYGNALEQVSWGIGLLWRPGGSDTREIVWPKVRLDDPGVTKASFRGGHLAFEYPGGGGPVRPDPLSVMI
jgi:KaiC/GvpD/RAD55 family RecA-like ATPase